MFVIGVPELDCERKGFLKTRYGSQEERYQDVGVVNAVSATDFCVNMDEVIVGVVYV